MTANRDNLIIELWPPIDDCCVCGAVTEMEYGLPMYESDIVPADWTGEWAGFTACRRCHSTFTGISSPIHVNDARRQLEREDGYHL
jgi:hypothetical protein